MSDPKYSLWLHQCIVQRRDLMTLEPHVGSLQRRAAGQQVPSEDSATSVCIDVTVGAVLVPESAAVEHGTVALVVAARPDIVVSVVRGEHHSVVIAERITARVTRVSGHLQSIFLKTLKQYLLDYLLDIYYIFSYQYILVYLHYH